MNGEEKYSKPCSRKAMKALIGAMSLSAWGVTPKGFEPVMGLRGNSNYTPSQLEALKRKEASKAKKKARKNV